IGGYRPNSGRPKKSDELAMIEKLKPLEETAHIMLADLVEAGNIRAIELFFKYMYGNPKQIVSVKQEKDDVKQVFKIGNKTIEL
ncbi:MAG: hypothetical protein NZ735_01690, partial [Candidatus Marinimicrobia bacterium]|nr:hypothetical protein [Candidatus Neomarinimicrobiota bacterium]